jgi:hypothetical protein
MLITQLLNHLQLHDQPARYQEIDPIGVADL